MKTRNGFVSNSSSASFIVGVKKDQSAKIYIEADLSDFADEMIDTEDQWKEYFAGYLSDGETIEQLMKDVL